MGLPLRGLSTSSRDVFKQIIGAINELTLMFTPWPKSPSFFPSLFSTSIPLFGPRDLTYTFPWCFFLVSLNALSLLIRFLRTPL